ncbi:MAG TPA: hypothetical protein VFT09_13875 [Ilumatobacteraceae bacterium]|nr:hypothetical protein [Ilumatobacteraceae bacterium]
MAAIDIEPHGTEPSSWLRRWWPSLAAVTVLVVVALVVLTMLGDDGETAPAVRAEGVVNELDVTLDGAGAEVRGSLLAGTVSVGVRNTGDGMVWTGIGRLADGRTLDAAQGALARGATGDWGALAGFVDFPRPLNALAAIRGPGDESTLTVSGVAAGDYVLVHLPLDDTLQPMWAHAGLQTLPVAAGDVGALATDVTYTVRGGRLVGPARLAAGRTDIGIVDESGKPSGLNVYRLTEPVDAVVAFFGAANGAPVDLSRAPIERFTLGADTDADQVISLELTPGQWLIEKKPTTAGPNVPGTGMLVEVS